DTEPRQPRLLNPKIDRDISTICLKSLEKDPKLRYSSALALAEDLEHWLKHEPILARRAGIFTRARKWVRRNPSTAVLITLLVTLAVGSGIVVWNRVFAVPMPKSVAVLPFENLNRDPDNAYFADGIQDEILTRLAKIADLEVISRTSAQRYQSKPGNLAEIAKQLGVANIVEGSVQKAGDQVRQEAAHFLSRINEQTPIDVKITQLTLERNYGEAIRLLQARLAQGHFSSEVDKWQYQTGLPLLQNLGGDNAGARLTAKQARDALDELSKNRTDDEIWAHLALANAVIGEKDQALKQAERSVMLYPSSKDPLNGPAREENLALIQTIVGENDRAISILTHLLQTSYSSLLYRTPVTPALLRLDPIWDPLRGDPAFQKLCEEKQP